MSIKNQALLSVGKLFWNAIKNDEPLQEEFIQFLIDRIPAISETATVAEVKLALKEDLEAIEATAALFKGSDEPAVEETVG